MADMIKFFKGLEASLPASGVNGALYITTDEGAIYLGTGTGMKRLGDFVQVANVASLPEKAHENCLYYCVAENILAKWNGSEWKQVNKQPTVEEMKTLLGLGSLAYKSEVAEGDLNSDLAKKINDASAANHGHDNKDVIDGITAEKVAAWDAAEGNAKTYADGLNTAMNTRVEALEAIDHEHANKALLDTYTQTEADLADAVAKKHSHTFVESELNKIADGDVAKWNAVVADHLDSEDLAALENSIKEAKKAGTDANTNIEAYKVTNDARVLAVEEDVAEIVNGENGILAQAKSYSDGKLATAKTEISAEIDADVKVVADELAGYKTSNDAALAGVKATAEAAATKEYTDAELAKKVDKTDYEADKATFATKTELGDVDAKFANYKTAAEQKSIDDAQDAEIAKKVDKVDGKDLIATSEIERLATLHNYDDTALAGRVTTAEGKITALETASATHATKDELNAVDAKFADYNTTVAQKAIDDAQDARIKAIEDDYVVAADIADFETKENVKKVADDLAAYVESNDAALAAETKARTDADADFETRIASLESNFGDGEGTVEAQIEAAVNAEKERAEGIEAGLRTDVDAVKADYLKAADKTELEGKITAEETRAKGVEESLQTQINTIMNNPDTEGVINSINEFTQYIADHGEIAEGFRTDIDKNKEDIAANAQAIADEIARAEGAEADLATAIETAKIEATNTAIGVLIEAQAYTDAAKTELKEHADGLNTAMDTRVQTLEAIDHDAYITADAALKDELSEAIEAAKTASSNQDAVVLAEAQNYTDALAGNVYTKEQTYTQDEVNVAIAAAVEAAHTWGEF